ncbi:histidine kinase [Aneurinibacillus soli]|uniref:histidine kinase n=1 Tax=Aneurinibacillus soli TaxID=1500254 RepID=A0A0U5BF35_9BACL|nr:histidine kinase [Aneurinibacillus soli]PYE59690.1 histidine kinase [Aneurinibacillus soli]BAU29309.1 Oxygen sensor histidine kinase NreB [Aneurinibacillus soli]
MKEDSCKQRKGCRNLNVHTFIETQEEVRTRLSHELHNGVGQALYSIVLGLQIINENDLDIQTTKHLADMRGVANKALHTVKDVVFELRPLMLDDLGIIPAVRSYIEMAKQKYGKEIDLEVLGETKRYDTAVETMLYRICQEVVMLSIHCSQVQRLVFRFQINTDSIQLDITAIGCSVSRLYGQESEKIAHVFAAIDIRARQVNGSMDIYADADNWTKLSITVPLSHPNREGGEFE